MRGAFRGRLSPAYWQLQQKLIQTGTAPPAVQPPPPASQQLSQPQDSNEQWYRSYPRRIALVTFLPLPPLMGQPQQTTYSLPGPYSEWQVYTEVPFAQWFIPPPPPTRQPNQRIDPLPDLNQEWRVYSRWQPVPVTFLPFPAVLVPRSQRIDPIPLEWSYQVRYVQTISGSVIPHDPPTVFYSQRIDPLPNLNQEWNLYSRQQPVPTTFLPLPPALRQASQYTYQLLTEGVYQPKTLNVPTAPAATPTFPVLSQRIDPLPFFDGNYQTRSFAPPSPPTPLLMRPSQRIDPLPNLNQEWQSYTRKWPTPVQYIPTPPPTRGPEQRQDALPDYTYLWYQQVLLQPPTAFVIPTPVGIAWAGRTNITLAWKGNTCTGLQWKGRTA